MIWCNNFLANEEFVYVPHFCHQIHPHSYESRASESGAAAGCCSLSAGWQQTWQLKISPVSHEAEADRLGKVFDKKWKEAWSSTNLPLSPIISALSSLFFMQERMRTSTPKQFFV